MLRLPIILALLLTATSGDDPYCPVYPKPQSQVFQARLAMERTMAAMTGIIEPTLIWSGPRGPSGPLSNNTATSVLLGSDTVGGADIQAFRDAVITSQGTIYGLIETTESEFVVVEAPSATALIQARDTITATANLSFLSFVPGARTGNPMIYTGGDPVSTYEVTSTGLTPSWISGEAEPGTPQSGNLSSAVRNLQGDLYFAAGNGIFRSGGTMETIVAYPATLTYSLFKSIHLDWTSTWFKGGNYFAANNAGMLV